MYTQGNRWYYKSSVPAGTKTLSLGGLNPEQQMKSTDYKLAENRLAVDWKGQKPKNSQRLGLCWGLLRISVSDWLHRRIARLCIVYPSSHVAAGKKSQALQACIWLVIMLLPIEQLISDSHSLSLSCPQSALKVDLSDIVSGHGGKF